MTYSGTERCLDTAFHRRALRDPGFKAFGHICNTTAQLSNHAAMQIDCNTSHGGASAGTKGGCEGKRDMHELALTQGIVDLATQVGRREGLHRISRVVVEVGVAAAVVPDALTFCFEIVAADTIARGADLVIETVGLRAACRACGTEFEPASLVSACPDCGEYGPRLLSGRELRVKSLDGE